jgi:hypothetical protein
MMRKTKLLARAPILRTLAYRKCFKAWRTTSAAANQFPAVRINTVEIKKFFTVILRANYVPNTDYSKCYMLLKGTVHNVTVIPKKNVPIS